MGSPSSRAPEQAPERFLVATEACGGGTLDLSSVLEVLGYIGIYRRKKYVRGATRVEGAPWGVGAPLPRAFLVDPLTCTPSLLYCFISKNNFSEGFIPFGLRLIFLFFETLKQAKNSNSGLGCRLIG